MRFFSLFPAYAGVILLPGGYPGGDSTFPRIRGGDPCVARPASGSIFFSPHTRG